MTFGNTKSPFASVVTGIDLVPRVSLMSVTVAPGITPPCGSFTVPPTEPVVSCAAAGSASSSRTMHAPKIPMLRWALIEVLLVQSIKTPDDPSRHSATTPFSRF